MKRRRVEENSKEKLKNKKEKEKEKKNYLYSVKALDGKMGDKR